MRTHVQRRGLIPSSTPPVSASGERWCFTFYVTSSQWMMDSQLVSRTKLSNCTSFFPHVNMLKDKLVRVHPLGTRTSVNFARVAKSASKAYFTNI